MARTRTKPGTVGPFRPRWKGGGGGGAGASDTPTEDPAICIRMTHCRQHGEGVCLMLSHAWILSSELKGAKTMRTP